ncbi:MAG: response regulator transcription factor [Oleiphilaceae bacterium]|nr:response regulator transcription factor [Oleiphilaceae bacterium]
MDSGRDNEKLQDIAILGSSGLQMHLLMDLLANEHHFRCTAICPDDLQTLNKLSAPRLILLDMHLFQEDDRFESDVWLSQPHFSKSRVALINVGPKMELDEWMQRSNCVGVFRETDEPELLVRGIRAILSGDFWFPRDLMARFLQQTRDQSSRSVSSVVSVSASMPELTPKELKVLRALCAGANNDEIAKKLSVSTHTVKSHLSNLYRKLNVKNRLEAVLWGKQSISDRAN